MLLKGLRNAVGLVIVAIDWLTRPRPVKRSDEDQEKLQQALAGLSLYQLYACPFCIKTRRALHRLNISLDIRDIGKNADYREELESQGGRVMVPCLRIEENGQSRWMYESGDIIRYLESKV